MAIETKFAVTVTTNKDLLGDDVEKFFRSVKALLPLLQMTGWGEKVGILDLKIKLRDRDVN